MSSVTWYLCSGLLLMSVGVVAMFVVGGGMARLGEKTGDAASDPQWVRLTEGNGRALITMGVGFALLMEALTLTVTHG